MSRTEEKRSWAGRRGSPSSMRTCGAHRSWRQANRSVIQGEREDHPDGGRRPAPPGRRRRPRSSQHARAGREPGKPGAAPRAPAPRARRGRLSDVARPTEDPGRSGNVVHRGSADGQNGLRTGQWTRKSIRLPVALRQGRPWAPSQGSCRVKILVTAKRVEDPESKIKVKPDGSGIVQEGLKYKINPFDEIAVEEGLRLVGQARRRGGGGLHRRQGGAGAAAPRAGHGRRTAPSG